MLALPNMNAVLHRRATCRRAALLAALLGACTCAAADAPRSAPADSAQAKAKLAAVRSRISELTDRLGKELKERDALSSRLREAELEITDKRRRLEALRASEAAAERRRSQLSAEQSQDQQTLAAERDTLAAQVRAAYMIGRQEQLKLLLNPGDPAALGRTLTYYEYFTEQRSATIAAIEAEVVRLSLANLMTFPWIAEAVAANRLALQGYWFDVHTGVLAAVGPDGLEPVE